MTVIFTANTSSYRRTIYRVVAALLCLILRIPLVFGEDRYLLELTVGDGVASNLPLFVYVNGSLAGVVPGTIDVSSDGPALIEVGVPQMDSPLYSMTVDPAALTSREIVLTTSLVENPHPQGSRFWKNVMIGPTYGSKASSMTVDAVGSLPSYKVVMPTESVSSLIRATKASGVHPTSADWNDFVPLKNYSPDAYKHSTYSKSMRQIIGLQPASGITWSGALPASVKLEISIGAKIKEETWTVKSTPEGAVIWTDRGKAGNTNADVEMEITGGGFMVLALDGYVQCPIQKCRKSAVGSRTEFDCELQKIAN